MSKLHRSQYDAQVFEPSEGQCRLLCSNNESSHCPSLSLNSPLSKDTLNSLEELGNVLKRIHKRMDLEGYTIIDGNMCKKTS